MKGIKWLFFDLFDTIVFVDEEIYYKGKREAAELTGIDPDNFISAWKSTSEEALIGKLKDPFQRANEALKKMGINDRNISAKIAIYDIETLQRCVSFYDGATEALSFLRERGFNLALLSNATATTAFILAPLHLRDRFDHLILSYEIGLKKPDPQFFKIALQRTNALAEESVFIGDGANKELDAAKEYGMKTLRINHPQKAHSFMDKHNLSSANHDEVKSFNELLKYFGY